MIQPLRKMHRTIFLVLGIALPVLFIGGLASRPAPLFSARPAEGELAQRSGGTEFVLNRASSEFRIRLLEKRTGGSEREFLAISDSWQPAADVFVYWSEARPAAALSPNTKLLGKLGPGELYRIPSGLGGYFVLYSVAQNEVLGSVAVGAAT